MQPIIDQLLEYCDCVSELKDLDSREIEKNVSEMISLISVLTCWAQEPCETFLNSERTEIFEVGEFDICSCQGGLFEFSPFYKEIKEDSLSAVLIEQDGIHDIEILIDKENISYSKTFNKIRVNVSSYTKGRQCGCKTLKRLVVKYDAGYELIPECLLQLFCDMLHVIFNKNNCDCSACQKCKDTDEEGQVFYDDDASPKIDSYLNNLVLYGYQKQLRLISLCKSKNKVWGVVV